MIKDTPDGQTNYCTHENSNTSGICNDCLGKSMNTKEQDWENKQIKFLKDVQEEYAQISSEWNGKSPGIKEERAQFANDIYDKCQELIELLQEFDNFD